eukprot:scaffold395_cov383-Prasinococcus_capsulatus_cf.AAC.9
MDPSRANLDVEYPPPVPDSRTGWGPVDRPPMSDKAAPEHVYSGRRGRHPQSFRMGHPYPDYGRPVKQRPYEYGPSEEGSMVHREQGPGIAGIHRRWRPPRVPADGTRMGNGAASYR